MAVNKTVSAVTAYIGQSHQYIAKQTQRVIWYGAGRKTAREHLQRAFIGLKTLFYVSGLREQRIHAAVMLRGQETGVMLLYELYQFQRHGLIGLGAHIGNHL